MIKNSVFIAYLELQNQVDQIFMSQVMKRNIKIDISTKDYPKVYLRVSTEIQEVCANRKHHVVFFDWVCLIGC